LKTFFKKLWRSCVRLKRKTVSYVRWRRGLRAWNRCMSYVSQWTIRTGTNWDVSWTYWGQSPLDDSLTVVKVHLQRRDTPT